MTDMDKLVTRFKKQYGRLTAREIALIGQTYFMITGKFPLLTDDASLSEEAKQAMHDCDVVTAEEADHILALEAELNKRN